MTRKKLATKIRKLAYYYITVGERDVLIFIVVSLIFFGSKISRFNVLSKIAMKHNVNSLSCRTSRLTGVS